MGLTELIKTSRHCIGSAAYFLGEVARFMAPVTTV